MFFQHGRDFPGNPKMCTLFGGSLSDTQIGLAGGRESGHQLVPLCGWQLIYTCTVDVPGPYSRAIIRLSYPVQFRTGICSNCDSKPAASGSDRL